jgi:DNA-binding NtrC family response regulator
MNQYTRTSEPSGKFGNGGPGRAISAKLVVVAGPDEGLEVPLNDHSEVGTDPSCDLVLNDPAVSRRHLSVATVSGRLLVRDLGSRNGTFMGGTRLMEAEVPLGALLVVGDTILCIQSRWHVREVRPSSERAFGELIGESVAMREVFAILEHVAPTDITVLVEGESGTGKELVGRSIHRASPRAGKPYVVFDCGSVPRELAESELFGHKRGSFSGAVADRAGAFGRADGGMIYLDEIGELPLELQTRLLRVLETGEIRAVGDDVPRRVDVRVVAATNRDLHAEVKRERFRKDLLYRLEVVRVRMPPLRQRPEDVAGLAAHMLAGQLPDGDEIDGDNLRQLQSYSWPGNVRELRNVLTRALALARRPGTPLVPFAQLVLNLGPASAEPTLLGFNFPGVTTHLPFKQAKAQLNLCFERAYADALLERHHGNVTRAAEAAGLSRKSLYELMRRGRPLDEEGVDACEEEVSHRREDTLATE